MSFPFIITVIAFQIAGEFFSCDSFAIHCTEQNKHCVLQLCCTGNVAGGAHIYSCSYCFCWGLGQWKRRYKMYCCVASQSALSRSWFKTQPLFFTLWRAKKATKSKKTVSVFCWCFVFARFSDREILIKYTLFELKSSKVVETYRKL